jgi:hypothetical protein
MPVVPGLPVGVLALVAEVLMALVPGWRPAAVALRVIAVMALAVSAAMLGRIGAVTRSAAVVVAV